ncbi:hypothetical protein F751_5150 [Auxenochlorella protothecoides]|uniref:Uncharacterized protein n=1 Tax=Auxenochlorella protothecoides TaxID=3075 RepID=A0A087SQN5_AUXPR|nr:hypothetical protein F751_5150 [Auxenochlorella protothecoides]KFM28039.1 hypothetical protein F751_5150 [Auxenochlorella protothecoides]
MPCSGCRPSSGELGRRKPPRGLCAAWCARKGYRPFARARVPVRARDTDGHLRASGLLVSASGSLSARSAGKRKAATYIPNSVSFQDQSVLPWSGCTVLTLSVLCPGFARHGMLEEIRDIPPWRASRWRMRARRTG